MPHAPELIERIRAQTDIVALIGRQVPLRRSGRNHMGCCPFHSERTPSFSVSAEKAMYYCFGCHQGGDVFAWVMQTQGLEFGDAVRHLAQLCGVELADMTPARKAQLAQQERLARLLDSLEKRLTRTLWAGSGSLAKKHLQQRRVPAPQARAWGLGYADDGEALCRALLKEGHSVPDMMEAGVIAEQRDPPWLLLHHRLTFPIRDITGRTLGFGGRTLATGTTQGPKYINTRDSALFHKRAALFGLFEAQKAIRQGRQVVLVEGFMDVLASHAAGLSHTVASLGTALTTDHAQSCRRLADEAVLMLDGDSAGERAAAKGAQALLQAGLRVLVAWLPNKEDPASLVQSQGAQALNEVLKGARPAVEALMGRAFERAPPSIEGRVQAAKGVMPLIDAMGESLERELYVGRLAAQVGVSTESLMAHWQAAPAQRSEAEAQVEAKRKGRSHGATKPRGASTPRPREAFPGPLEASGDGGEAQPPIQQLPKEDLSEWSMVQELLLFVSLRPKLTQVVEYLQNPRAQQFLQALANYPTMDDAALQQLIEAHVTDPGWRRRLTVMQRLAAQDLDEGPERANRTLDDILRRLKWRHVDVALRRVLGQLRETERRGDATEELLRRKQELTARKRTLSGVGR